MIFLCFIISKSHVRKPLAQSSWQSLNNMPFSLSLVIAPKVHFFFEYVVPFFKKCAILCAELYVYSLLVVF